MNTLNVTNDKKSGVSLKVHLIFYVLDKYVGKMWDTGVVETHVISLVWPCNTPFSRRMDILLPCNLKEAVQKRSVTPCSLHPPCVYLACLVREQLHRILPLTTAHVTFGTWRKSFYNRPSDCCFRLTYFVALLMPITYDLRTRERWNGYHGNSTIRQSSPPYRFVNRVSTFMDTVI